MARQVFISRRIYCTIPTENLSTYLPKSTSFVPARTDLEGKLLTAMAFSQKIVPILFRPIRRMFHLSLFGASTATKKTPNIRPVLNPKGHAKADF